MHHVGFNKQGLRVAKQSLRIIQTEAHSCKERYPSSSNRASVWTKRGLCVRLKSLLVFFMRCRLNPGVQRTVQFSVQYSIGMWDVHQTLIELWLASQWRPNVNLYFQNGCKRIGPYSVMVLLSHTIKKALLQGATA